MIFIMILIKKNRLSRKEISSLKKILADMSKSLKDTETIPTLENKPAELTDAPAAAA